MTAGLSFSIEGFFHMFSTQMSSTNKPAASKLKAFFARAAVAAIGIAGSGAAMASTDNTFDNFRDTVLGWAEGSLGTGLSITMMIIGAGMGIARNSPMPALSGIAGAAFLNWGPDIIARMLPGALI